MGLPSESSPPFLLADRYPPIPSLLIKILIADLVHFILVGKVEPKVLELLEQILFNRSGDALLLGEGLFHSFILLKSASYLLTKTQVYGR